MHAKYMLVYVIYCILVYIFVFQNRIYSRLSNFLRTQSIFFVYHH